MRALCLLLLLVCVKCWISSFRGRMRKDSISVRNFYSPLTAISSSLRRSASSAVENESSESFELPFSSDDDTYANEISADGDEGEDDEEFEREMARELFDELRGEAERLPVEDFLQVSPAPTFLLSRPPFFHFSSLPPFFMVNLSLSFTSSPNCISAHFTLPTSLSQQWEDIQEVLDRGLIGTLLDSNPTQSFTFTST